MKLSAARPRYLEAPLRDALRYSPAVLLQGSRQCGKTTLARMVGESGGYSYYTFDAEETRAFAESDPAAFVRGLPERVILDEAQKVPRLFSTLKLSIDQKRRPGRFILTGSVNVLQVRQITDSLAGRMQIITLRPFSQGELSRAAPGFLDALFRRGFPQQRYAHSQKDLAKRMAAGGYPDALRLRGRRRLNWHNSYIQALVQRDVPDLSKLRSPEVLAKLLVLAAGRSACLFSANNLAAALQLNRTSGAQYLSLLQQLFLLQLLPAWHGNRSKRLIKTPKLHFGDTGTACALLDLDAKALLQNRELLGRLLETFVFQELQKQAEAHKEVHKFFHYRERTDAATEVDIVVQRGGAKLAGVEVKAASTINAADFRGLRRFKAAAGKNFAGGVLLYNGEHSGSFGGKLYAAPLSALWEIQSGAAIQEKGRGKKAARRR